MILNPFNAENFENYNHEKIQNEAQNLKAIIKNIDTDYYVTMNNQHPSTISYDYKINAKIKTDKFKTLDPFNGI